MGPAAGASLTLSATVGNAGDGESPPTALRYYRSSDETITTSDRMVGTDDVGTLSPGGTSAMSISLTAPSPPVAIVYHYGACVETVAGESDTTNNCSPGALLAPILPRHCPDLVAGSPSISKIVLDTGEEFTVSATVHNRGDGDAAATTLRFYLARRWHTTYNDNEVGADAVAELAPAGSSGEKSLTTTAPTDTDADHFYRACVDAPLHEIDKRNNCTDWVRYYVSNPQGRPDLAIGMVGGRGVLPPGRPVPFGVYVSNVGHRKSAPTTLRWYVTTDSTPNSDETGSPVFIPENEVRTQAIEELHPLEVSGPWFGLTAPAEPGNYQYGLCVDTVPDESDRSDDCLSAYEMEIEVR